MKLFVCELLYSSVHKVGWKAQTERDHHRGLNSWPVSTDRKRLNGMLCLSAF